MNGNTTFPIFPSASCVVNSISFDDIKTYGYSFDKLEHDYKHILESRHFCDKRKKEFLAGRYCGKKAVESLLKEKFDDIIDINSDRTPNWPSGIVGTITHTRNLAGAAVGFEQNLQSIGIDYEAVLSAVRANYLKDAILTKNEMVYLSENKELDFNVFSTLIFSAKESIFKCVYPLIHRYFEADEVDIFNVDIAASRFEFRLLGQLKNVIRDCKFFGYCSINDKYVCTLVEMKA